VVELAYREVGGPLGDVPVSAHRVGWPKMTKAFLKNFELLLGPIEPDA